MIPLVGLTMNSSLYAQIHQEKAEFAIHLFQDGQPIKDAELVISSESADESTAKLIFEATPSTYSWKTTGDAPLKTDANGSLAAKLPPGTYQIHIKTKGESFLLNYRYAQPRMCKY